MELKRKIVLLGLVVLGTVAGDDQVVKLTTASFNKEVAEIPHFVQFWKHW